MHARLTFTGKRVCVCVYVYVFQKKLLQLQTPVSREGAQLISWALRRDEAKRCEAAQAVHHPFVSGS